MCDFNFGSEQSDTKKYLISSGIELFSKSIGWCQNDGNVCNMTLEAFWNKMVCLMNLTGIDAKDFSEWKMWVSFLCFIIIYILWGKEHPILEKKKNGSV